MEEFGFELRQTLEPALSTELMHKLLGRLKLANFMELPETGFNDFIRKIEDDPLFRKFCYTYQREQKIIGFRRFPRSDLARGKFLELNEEITPQSGSYDIESLVESHRSIVEAIRKLGSEKFKQCFLYADDDMTIPEIVEKSGLPEGEVARIFELVNSVFLHHEMLATRSESSTAGDPSRQLNFQRVASIEKVNGAFTVGFFMPSFVRGRYVINYDRLESMNKEGALAAGDYRKMRHLLKKLELINTRKSIVYRILETIITVQGKYLETGAAGDLRPFILKNLSSMFSVSLGLISRAMQGKSVATPWGEMPIKFFFPNERWGKRELVREIIQQEKVVLSDEKIRALIKERYGLELSRRAINSYRVSLKIESSYERKRQLAEPAGQLSR